MIKRYFFVFVMLATPYCLYAMHNNDDIVKVLVENVVHDRHDVVSELLRHGVPAQVDNTSAHPLILAASSVEMLCRLKEAGLSPHAHDEDDNTLLHILAARASVSLSLSGCESDKYLETYYSKLRYSDLSKVSALIAFLVKEGLDINTYNCDNRRPLYFLPIVPYARVFIQHGALVSEELRDQAVRARIHARLTRATTQLNCLMEWIDIFEHYPVVND